MSGDAASAFVPTRWTLVLRARGGSAESRAALSELCEAYYAPVHAFIRRVEPDLETARDLTQGFFADLLAQQSVGAVEPGRGRFRSYLLGAVKHFLAESRRKAAAAKRGGGQRPVSLEVGASTDTTSEWQVPDPAATAPDALFDRQWATTLVDRAAAVLASESQATGRGEQFDALKPWLLGNLADRSQAEAAQELGMSEGALKVAIHRLRARFRELVKAEIAQTVDHPSQVAEELRYLVDVLAQPVPSATRPDPDTPKHETKARSATSGQKPRSA
jgi:RNA polymerase sigma-70 factor (ECF subfamily)